MNRNVTCRALVLAFFGATGMAAANPGDLQDDSRESGERAKVEIGYAIAPVALDTRRKNRALIGLGSYIVNAQSACSDCHTHPNYAPGGDPYGGQPEVLNAKEYLSGGRQFGPFTSANITPDASGRPAGLTFEQFQEVIRSGRDPDGSGRILQVMPWPTFGKMTDRDLQAIYEYLRAVPSLPDNAQPGP
jgi:hypothetical protein